MCSVQDEWLSRISAAMDQFQSPNSQSKLVNWQALMEFGRQLPSDIRERMCMTEPCKNMGSCVQNLNNPLGYACQCAAGYTGAQCEYGLSTYLFLFIYYNDFSKFYQKFQDKNYKMSCLLTYSYDGHVMLVSWCINY